MSFLLNFLIPTPSLKQPPPHLLYKSTPSTLTSSFSHNIPPPVLRASASSSSALRTTNLERSVLDLALIDAIGSYLSTLVTSSPSSLLPGLVLSPPNKRVSSALINYYDLSFKAANSAAFSTFSHSFIHHALLRNSSFSPSTCNIIAGFCFGFISGLPSRQGIKLSMINGGSIVARVALGRVISTLNSSIVNKKAN
ncbi:hypothetical protein RCL1_000004 [Eukaryota sp. TZLM3-RCL]